MLDFVLTEYAALSPDGVVYLAHLLCLRDVLRGRILFQVQPQPGGTDGNAT